VTDEPSDPTRPRRTSSPRPSQLPRQSQAPRPSQLPRPSQHPSQPPRLAQSAAPDARELVRSTRSDAPNPTLREQTMARVLLRYRQKEKMRRVAWVALGSGVAIAALLALWVRANPPVQSQLAHETPTREAPPALSQKRAAPSPPVASAPAPELEPCTPAVRAAGTESLIDDFEDNDARIASLEHRAGFWSASNDNTATQRPALGGPLSIARIPGGRGSSRFALHTSGGRFSKWGALLAADLSARRCYDASAYGGLRFWARGRGTFNVVAKMTQIAPEEYGGSCTHDCYDAHRATLTLTNAWQEQRVTWGELKQKGFGQALSFDPRSLLSIEFSVTPEQTPFDFWVDDVHFLER